MHPAQNWPTAFFHFHKNTVFCEEFIHWQIQDLFFVRNSYTGRFRTYFREKFIHWQIQDLFLTDLDIILTLFLVFPLYPLYILYILYTLYPLYPLYILYPLSVA